MKEGVEMRFGCQVKEVDQAVPAVTLQDGTRLEADLIVAADGI
jgi:2-polyprenyl-6-methoxyphenol hydroxylase-like FAD-dependent oxidoreductase